MMMVLAQASDDPDWKSNSTVGRATWLQVFVISTRFKERHLNFHWALPQTIGRNEPGVLTTTDGSQPLIGFLGAFKDASGRLNKALHFSVKRLAVDSVYNDFPLERTLIKQIRASPAELITVSGILLSCMFTLTGNRHL